MIGEAGLGLIPIRLLHVPHSHGVCASSPGVRVTILDDSVDRSPTYSSVTSTGSAPGSSARTSSNPPAGTPSLRPFAR